MVIDRQLPSHPCPAHAQPYRPIQALITRLCKEAAAAAADQQQRQQQQQQQQQLPPAPGLGAAREDTLLLARLLDVMYTANVQVRG